MFKVSIIAEHLARPIVRSFDDAGEAERYIIQLAIDYAKQGDMQEEIDKAGADVNLLMYILGNHGVELAYWEEE